MFYRMQINLKEILKNKNMNESDLALALKVNIDTLHSWETGIILPAPEIMVKLACILNVSIDSLVFSENREPLEISELNKVNKTFVRDFCNYIKKQ